MIHSLCSSSGGVCRESRAEGAQRPACPCIGKLRIEDDLPRRQRRQTKPRSEIDGIRRRHPARQRRHRQTRGNRSTNGGQPATDKNLRPGYARGIESTDSHRAHAARLGLGRKPQRLAGLAMKIRRRHPAEWLFKQHIAVTAVGVVPEHDRGIQRAVIE